jgi:hypothetical protein
MIMKSKTMEPNHIGGQLQASDILRTRARNLLSNTSLVDNYFEQNPSKVKSIEGFGYDIETPLAEYFLRHLDSREHPEFEEFFKGYVPITNYPVMKVAPLFAKLQMEPIEMKQRIEFESELFEDQFVDQTSFKLRTSTFIKELIQHVDELNKES